jgi:hypothetical protein
MDNLPSFWQAKVLLHLLLLLMLFRSPFLKAQSPIGEEAQIRAAMIVNLIRYVDWPAWKFTDDSAPFVLCFLPNDKVGDYAQFLVRERAVGKLGQEHVISDRSVVVRRVDSAGTSEMCHVFYSSRGDRKKLATFSNTFAKTCVLTVSDQQSSAEHAMVTLPLIESHVQIVVDLTLAQQSGIVLSSRLLRIAAVTR